MSEKRDPAIPEDEIRTQERGLWPAFDQLKGAIGQIQGATRVLARGVEFLEHAYSSAQRVEQAARDSEPEPEALRGARLLQRLVTAAADLPSMDRWLSTIEDAETAERLRQLLEDLAELRQLTGPDRADTDESPRPERR